VWPGLPPQGNPEDADAILVQAFGRNHYPDVALRAIREIRDRVGTDARAVEVLQNHHFDPGIPNRSLARECQVIMDRFPQLRGIVQWEIATAFEGNWYHTNAYRVVCVWPPKQGYFSTLEVKRDSKQEMSRLGLSLPIELAHRRQIVRAFLIVRKLFGITPIVLEQQTHSFDSSSVQLWTRTWYWWLIREVLGRVHHVVKRLVL
jgi:hypothetical protein